MKFVYRYQILEREQTQRIDKAYFDEIELEESKPIQTALPPTAHDLQPTPEQDIAYELMTAGYPEEIIQDILQTAVRLRLYGVALLSYQGEPLNNEPQGE